MTIEQVADEMNYSAHHVWKMLRDALSELENAHKCT